MFSLVLFSLKESGNILFSLPELTIIRCCLRLENAGEVFYYLENVENIFIKYYLSRPCIRIFPSFLFFSLKWQDLNALTNQFNAFG